MKKKNLKVLNNLPGIMHIDFAEKFYGKKTLAKTYTDGRRDTMKKKFWNSLSRAEQGKLIKKYG